jgi:hypothetical protein
MQTSAPTSARPLFLAGLAAVLLSACATPAPAPAPAIEPLPAATVSDTLRALATPVQSLSADDPGIAALARTVSGADLISFEGGNTPSLEEAVLKSALTEALAQSGMLGLLILDVPCDGAAVLDSYAGGAATGQLAAEIVRAAPIHDSQKSAALADTLTVLRGWNAVNIDKTIRISGMHCAAASEADTDRTAIFWGVDQLPAHAGEKDLAAAARRYGEAAQSHVWIVQTDDASLSDVIPGSGWMDLRALPETPEVAGWRQQMAETLPLLRPLHPSAADIVFRHAATTPAEPF